jgi:hypothetical protein
MDSTGPVAISTIVGASGDFNEQPSLKSEHDQRQVQRPAVEFLRIEQRERDEAACDYLPVFQQRGDLRRGLVSLKFPL